MSLCMVAALDIQAHQHSSRDLSVFYVIFVALTAISHYYYIHKRPTYLHRYLVTSHSVSYPALPMTAGGPWTHGVAFFWSINRRTGTSLPSSRREARSRKLWASLLLSDIFCAMCGPTAGYEPASLLHAQGKGLSSISIVNNLPLWADSR